MPRFAGRCRQLSEARATNLWLAAGSVIVQQQAIRDHDQATRNYFAGDAPPTVVAEGRPG
jgi:putative transposase